MKPFLAFGSIYLVLATMFPASDRGILSLCLQGASSVAPGSILTAWSFAPAVTAPFAFAACVYLVRKPAPDRAQQALFACGFILLALALVSPLCRLAANLASAHMVQHVVLVAVAPPLLVIGMRGDRIAADRILSRLLLLRPGLCAAIYGLLIWIWHVPRFYQRALLDPTVHLLMYGSLILGSVLFWTSILSARRGAPHGGWAMLALLVTFVHTGLLGALLLFSPRLWYPLLTASSAPWGLDPLEDQQLAGLIMWVPMGLVYLIAAVWLMTGALSGPAKVRAARQPDDPLIE